MVSSANGTSRFGFRYSPAAAGVFSNPAYANSSSSDASPSTPSGGMLISATRDHSTKKMPIVMKTASGTTLAISRPTATPAPCLTPITLIHVSSPISAPMIAIFGTPDAAGDQRKPTASANPFDSDAMDATRASHVIQPTSNPTNAPKASRAYRYAPPGSSK